MMIFACTAKKIFRNLFVHHILSRKNADLSRLGRMSKGAADESPVNSDSHPKEIVPNIDYVNLTDMRTPYRRSSDHFLETDLVSKEPFGQFKVWFDAACQTPGITEPNSMALATSTRDGKPSVRMVLLKGFGPSGFKFFTNYDSRKGQELEENPRASLLFYWEVIKRQVRIEGTVQKLSEEESTEYFLQRPERSQIVASISHQSFPVPSRDYLLERANDLHSRCLHLAQLSKPSSWGGYSLMPEVIEFWQGQTDRLHDRIRFRRPSPSEILDPKVSHVGDDGWIYERLAP